MLAFDDPPGCGVRAAIFDGAAGELAVTAWVTSHNDMVKALHLRLDRASGSVLAPT